MLEVIYRIYEMIDTKRDRFNGGIREVTMDCKVCDTREQFKELIKEEWGNIPFARTKKLRAGDLYCVIIGEHCFNTERFFIKKNFECSHCHMQMEGFYGKPIQFSNSEIKFELFGLDKYKVEKFCCSECKNARIEQLHRQLQQGCEDIEDYWITKDMFEKEQQGILGYIYKITKRSTGEFYIGQTQSVPVFRWGNI